MALPRSVCAHESVSVKTTYAVSPVYNLESDRMLMHVKFSALISEVLCGDRGGLESDLVCVHIKQIDNFFTTVQVAFHCAGISATHCKGQCPTRTCDCCLPRSECHVSYGPFSLKSAFKFFPPEKRCTCSWRYSVYKFDCVFHFVLLVAAQKFDLMSVRLHNVYPLIHSTRSSKSDQAIGVG